VTLRRELTLLCLASLYSLSVYSKNECLLPRDELTTLSRIAVISDLNSEYGSVEYEPRIRQAIDRIIALRPDLVLSNGDMVAGQWRNLGPGRLRAMWESFRQIISGPLFLAGIPFAVTPGNHDAAPGYEEDQQAFLEEWTLKQGNTRLPKPYLLSGGWIRAANMNSYPFHYSFSMKGIFFVSLNATYLNGIPSAQHQWLLSELDSHAKFPLKIVFGHVPLQPVAQGRVEEALFSDQLEADLKSRGVQYYLSGHHHAFYPGLLRSGLHQISTGALGQGQRRLLGREERAPAAFTLLDVGYDYSVTVRSCRGDEFLDREEISSLPERIDWVSKKRRGTIRRMD
jgi:hypothetical protein